MNSKSKLLAILALGFAIRMLFSSVWTLELDQNSFIAWGARAKEFGMGHFYDSWSDYLPGFIYILTMLSHVEEWTFLPSEVLYKLPAILADVLSGGLIYLIVTKLGGKTKTALIGAGLYLFNAAILANSTFWGQVDSITSLFSLLSLWSVNFNVVLSAAFLAIGMLVKPQAVFMLPVILYILYQKGHVVRDAVAYAIVGASVVMIAFLPFAGDKNLPIFISERVGVTLGQYPYTSLNAFNFWSLWGFWKPDTEGFLPPKMVGYILSLVFSLVGFLAILKNRHIPPKVQPYVFSASLFLISFLFFTRIHERHMLPTFAPLAVAASFVPQLWLPYFVLSAIYVANMIYAFTWITQDFTEVFPKGVVSLLSLVNISMLFWIFFVWRKKISLPRINKKEGNYLSSLPKLKLPSWFLILVIGFSVITRLLFLQSPKGEYFDEVYHAFTARIMLHSDPKAWEWWNPHPEGFAYEWTHPPLAKEGMVLGMLVVGENSVGWRLPGALLGVGVVLLVYLTSKELFDREVGVLAAGVMALEGLPLVMSRIGMNDTYFLFSILFSYYLFIKKKHLPSALFLGLAAASKWSTMWFLPILLVTHFVLKRKISKGYVWYFTVPPLVYMATYIPMFVTGHGFDIFWGMQKQMWWYHTQLDATHPYTSSWWSWPLLIRPIWLYTSGVIDGMVANIYAMGNPFIFWSGVVSVFYILYEAVRLRDKRVGLIVFSYFAFFAAWAISPRIMFLYHYLPSVPFMAIAIGLMLRKQTKLIPYFFVVALVLFLYFYPHWTGVSIPEKMDLSYYWFSSWR